MASPFGKRGDERVADLAADLLASWAPAGRAGVLCDDGPPPAAFGAKGMAPLETWAMSRGWFAFTWLLLCCAVTVALKRSLAALGGGAVAYPLGKSDDLLGKSCVAR